MAEALTRFLGGDKVDVHSAGTEQGVVADETKAFIHSLGFNPDDYESKTFDQFLGQNWNFVITVCDRANENCPVFPGDPERIHWSIPNPNDPQLSPEKRMQLFRKVSFELKQRITLFLQSHLE